MRNWVLVKGIRQDQRFWMGVPERVAEATGGEVVCLDLPGTGTEAGRRAPTSVDGLVDDLRARFASQRPVDGPWGLLGLSLGGMIALRWAARYPGDFAGVAVGNTSARDAAPPWWRLTPGALWSVVRASTTLDPMAREVITARQTTSLQDEEGLRRVAEAWRTFQAETPLTRGVLLRQLLAGMTFRAPDALAPPLRVLVGEGDRFVDPRCSRRLARRLGAEVRTHPTAGHDLGLDAPEWLVSELVDFGEALAGASA